MRILHSERTITQRTDRNVDITEYTTKDSKIIFTALDKFFKSNPGYNARICEVSGELTTDNKKKAFSNAINLRNGRLLLCPYEENSIKLLNMADGSIFPRPMPNEVKDTRYVNAHQHHGSIVIMIPADSNKHVLVYDVATAKYDVGAKCQVNGDLVLKDIFSSTVLMENGSVFCANKNLYKPFIYNPYLDSWEGIDGAGYYQTPGEGSGCLLSNGTVLLTGRQDVETKQNVLQIFDPKTWKFTNLVDFQLSCSDEFVSIIPEDNLVVWLLPYNGKRIVRLDLKTMEYKEYFIPESMLEVLGERGLTLGGCKLPNGNIFLSPYGLPYGVEFSVTTKKWTPCPHTSIDTPSYTGGAILMSNGLVFSLPAFRKSGIVYGTEVENSGIDLYINQFTNTSK